MPAEPDNSKIDELLKAYAKKRREEMGTPIELHPAVRKMLQGEVAKQHPAPPSERKSIFSVFVQFWPRFAIAGAAVMLLSLVLVNITQHPNPDEARQMAREKDELLKEREEVSDLARDKRAPAPVNAPASKEFFEIGDRISGEKSAKDVRLQRELKVAQNEAIPVQPRPDGLDGAAAQKPVDRFGAESSRRGEVKLADELSVMRESLDRKAAPAPERRLTLGDDKAKADADHDAYLLGRGAGLAGGVANPAPSEPRPSASKVAGPQTGLSVAQAGSRPVPAQNLSDQPPSAGALGVNGNAIADPTANRGLYAIAPPPPVPGAAPNQPALPQLSASAAATSETLLAYDTVKQQSFFKQSSVTLDSQPAPVPAEQWYGYFENVQNAPVVSARFANVSQQMKLAEAAKTETKAKKADTSGEGTQPQPLSGTFSVQQDRDRIRIVDFDGSVYDGRVLQRANVVDGEKQKAQKSEQPVDALVEFGDIAAPTEQAEASFTASGTNRTLKKLVVVSGTLLGEPAQVEAKERAYRSRLEGVERANLRTPEPAKTATLSKAIAATNQVSLQILTASSIKGSVRVDSTNELKIEARRVSTK